jgi:CcmD family protein
MKFLYLAYTATWTIHLAYIRYLSGRYRRMRNEAKELGKN